MILYLEIKLPFTIAGKMAEWQTVLLISFAGNQ